MSLNIETYALCKKFAKHYCDTHASTLTPEQAVAAVNTYFSEHPGEIVTNEELETILEEAFEDYATKTWVEEKGYLIDAVIEVEALPTANIKTDVVYRLKKSSTESCLGTLINRYSPRTDLSNSGNKVTTGVDADGVHYWCQWKWLNLCYSRVAPSGQDVVPIEQYWESSMPRTFGEKAKDLFYVDANGPLVRYTDLNGITQACYKDTWLNSFHSYEYYSYNGFSWDRLVLDKELDSELQSYMPLITLPTGEDKKFNFILQLHSDATSSYQWEEQEDVDLSEYAKTTEVTSAVNTAVADLIDGAPETLDTLKELADNFDGMATQSWVESKGYVTEALPEGTEDGQALIYVGDEWTKQNNYGYELAPETNINFDGDTDGLTEIATAYFPFYKLPYDGYLPTAEDLMGQTVYYKYNGSLETSEWNADDIQSSPEGTLELMKDNFSDTIIIVYDEVTMPKYDNGLFSKGIWIAKQDDDNYIMDIYFGPVVNQIASKFIPSDDNKANVDDVVNLTEDQTINGEKEFVTPIKFESGLSTTSYGQGGVSIGAFAQPLTKYNFATDGSDYVTDGEVTVAAREWVEAQGYLTNDSLDLGEYAKTEDINIPTKVSELENDSGFITGEDAEAGDPVPIDADTLEGHSADYFQTALPAAINNKYLHANATTGELEWIEVSSSGGGDASISDNETSNSSTWSSQKMIDTFEQKTFIALTLAKSDNTTVNNVTVTVKDRVTGDILNTYTYNNAPITITLPNRIPYKISVSSILDYITPIPVTGTSVGTRSITMTYQSGVVYGYHINSSEGDPALKVTYLEDAVGMIPAYMDFTNDTFKWGSWENAFFMPKPCMLKYDGTVDYYLNPNDYNYKEDGVSLSHISNTEYNGNAMMEWGQNGKKIWYKIVPDSADPTNADVYISDAQQDENYKAWSFMDYNGNYIDHFYTPIFNGSVSNGYLRSISGLIPMSSQNVTTEIQYATAQNQTSTPEWYTEVFCDITLINILLVLMGKTLNTQTAFGYGHYTGGSSASNLLTTGTMNTKGMFWGTSGTGSGVKVFGMENWWGNQWRRYAGHMSVNGVQKYKMTPSTADSSTTTGYNLTGDGYVSSGITCTGSNGGYITTEKYLANVGMFPLNMNSTSTTNYCDGCYYNNSGTRYPGRGGASGDGFCCGSFAVGLGSVASVSRWDVGAALSCKPAATI